MHNLRGVPAAVFDVRWEDAQMDDGAQIAADWDLAAQASPDYEVDQRVNW
jgi:hypothetical protein